MINIIIEPIGITIAVKKGEPLHQGLEKAGIRVDNPCGGTGGCGRCSARMAPPEKVPPTPHKHISKQEEQAGFRLVCQAVPEDNITLWLTDNFVYDKTSNDAEDRIISKIHLTETMAINPSVRVVARQNDYLLHHDRSPEPILLRDWHSSFTPRGLAIDIGTTTMVLALVCLETGTILASGSSLNPQVAHGYDVLSRIQYAKTRQAQEEMAALVRDKLNALLSDALEKTRTDPLQILDVCIGGNTTMLQMAAAMDCSSIGKAPFTFDIKGGCSHPASLFKLNVNPAAQVYLPPIQHAFVGTDISAGLLCCPGFFDPGQAVLFIDMGTNGEICLNAKGKWYTASTAAGPAFEGMGLSTGMRAKKGAVEKVAVRKGHFSFHTIGGTRVKGLCGSGIIDLLSALLESGYMDASGRLWKKEDPDPYFRDLDGMTAFDYGEGVLLTQKDIRQIQLAKSAVRTGIDLVLKQGNIDAARLDKFYIAGGFGNFLNPAHMEKIGLLPPQTASRVLFCGNSSLTGSHLLLMDKDHRTFLEKTLNAMAHVPLAHTREFTTQFLKNLNFPAIVY